MLRLANLHLLALAAVLGCSGAAKGPPGPSWADDPDHDAIKGGADGCPNVAEDWDGFKDDDGCPDPDHDGDGIADADDECPSVAGDQPSGCPGIDQARRLATMGPDDLDKDHDGVFDLDEACDDQPEDQDDFEDSDGCPDPDNDGDGFLDGNDTRCPNDPEDGRGANKTDGCPAPDGDGDGIIDELDRCQGTGVRGKVNTLGCPDSDNDGLRDPNYKGETGFGVDRCPSMRDLPSDGDGCPGTDADGDGIRNAADKCPDAGEDYDSVDDEDGCPEAA